MRERFSIKQRAIRHNPPPCHVAVVRVQLNPNEPPAEAQGHNSYGAGAGEWIKDQARYRITRLTAAGRVPALLGSLVGGIAFSSMTFCLNGAPLSTFFILLMIVPRLPNGAATCFHLPHPSRPTPRAAPLFTSAGFDTGFYQGFWESSEMRSLETLGGNGPNGSEVAACTFFSLS